jgi:hypothetical protein
MSCTFLCSVGAEVEEIVVCNQAQDTQMAALGYVKLNLRFHEA